MLAHAQENKEQIGIVTNALKVGIYLMSLPFSAWMLASNYQVMIRSARRSSSLLKEMKNHAKVCDEVQGRCDKDPQECLEFALTSAIMIRDLAVQANDISRNVKGMRLITKLTEKTAVDWDDFVVGLTLSSDTEMNDSIALLADAV